MVRLTMTSLVLLLSSACGPRELRVTMNADNNSGQRGFATIQDRGTKVFVTVETSAPDYFGGMGQLVHLHDGNCGEIGERKFGLQLMKPLEDRPDRFGAALEVALPMKTFESGDWLINVHDERDSNIYVSCGEIPKP